MLIAGSRLLDLPVMSLQTGGEIARTSRAIIDPADLSLVAYELSGPLLSQAPSYIRIDDIRELSDIGFIVDSAEEFVATGDIIKLDETISYYFDVVGRTVTSEKKRKLGKVIDYTVEIATFTIQQLSVRRPLLKSINDTELLIHRSQIIEINDKSIVINETADIPEHTRVTTPGAYVNPFRGSRPAAETADTNKQ